MNETPRFFNLSDCFRDTPPTRRGHCFGCLDGNMVSVFVVLIFVPATEHENENLLRSYYIPYFGMVELNKVIRK